MKISWYKQDYLYYIINKTRKRNIDNISRTKAYQDFYKKYPEIKWALVASIVSRNAGWNMTDLALPPYRKILSQTERRQLFMTYERANWLIFSDAFPQLLVYDLSVQYNKSLFNLLAELEVSSFMISEWHDFWKTKDQDRLMLALIINEQNVIQRPVISQSYFKKKVFLSLSYQLQNYLLLNAVILPTREGELYGSYVHGFTNVSKRINLGKRLASQIFDPNLHSLLMDFMNKVEHTGSRYDYERFCSLNLPKSPMLRRLYPAINHQDNIRFDWFKLGGIRNKWFEQAMEEPNTIGSSFYKKRKLLFAYSQIRNIFG